MSGVRGNLGALKALAAKLGELPKSLGSRVAKAAQPDVNTVAHADYPAEHVDTGRALASIVTRVSGRKLRVLLRVPYARYILRYGALPRFLPASWAQAIAQHVPAAADEVLR